jgi:hypothetical protein
MFVNEPHYAEFDNRVMAGYYPSTLYRTFVVIVLILTIKEII